MDKLNQNRGTLNGEEPDRFPPIDLGYPISKEQVWSRLVMQMDQKAAISMRHPSPYLCRLAVAASLALFVALGGFLRFYSKSVNVQAGQHLTYDLPDHSVVALNAHSTMTYYPYWYRFSRKITLQGEAFFKVIPGSEFTVSSSIGETTVLGTSFNIFSRDNAYSVTCFTGKVKVASTASEHTVLLEPGQQAFINQGGALEFVPRVNLNDVKSWRENMFVFTGTPIVAVLNEIERQYAIKITFKGDSNLTYTGNFSRLLTKNQVLDLVCSPLGLKFEGQSEAEFLID